MSECDVVGVGRELMGRAQVEEGGDASGEELERRGGRKDDALQGVEVRCKAWESGREGERRSDRERSCDGPGARCRERDGHSERGGGRRECNNRILAKAENYQ